jgi:hypothetical protein
MHGYTTFVLFEPAEALETTFKRLGFAVECHDDLTARDIEATLKEVASRDHTLYDCFVCCVMSHGNNGYVCGVDSGGKVYVDKFKSFFKPRRCNCPDMQRESRYIPHKCKGPIDKGLLGKPKLFFVQTCRGHLDQEGQLF